MESYIAYFFYGLCALSALCILFTRDVLRAALYLLLCLLSAAALYIFMMAEFLAVAQILVYAGGIIIVILFGIMLTAKISDKPLIVQHGNIVAGIIGGLGVFMLLAINLQPYFSRQAISLEGGGDRVFETGILLMTTYLLPFEIAGVLLLVALIGASFVATTSEKRNNER
jgi:NADH:ubiquinone oxidoreductase subunit 6 (subunit J)